MSEHQPQCMTNYFAHAQCDCNAGELERLRAELAAILKREKRVRGIGGQLSNVAFNLAQRAGHVISSDDCSLLDGLRKQWDDALAEGAQG